MPECHPECRSRHAIGSLGRESSFSSRLTLKREVRRGILSTFLPKISACRIGGTAAGLYTIRNDGFRASGRRYRNGLVSPCHSLCRLCSFQA